MTPIPSTGSPRPSPLASAVAASSTASASEPPGGHAAGSPSSPLVRWAREPVPGLRQLGDFGRGYVRGVRDGAVGTAAGLWELATSPREVLGPWVEHPKDTAVQMWQAEKQKVGDMLKAARQGDFEPLGHFYGERDGASAAGAAMGEVGGVLLGKAATGASALRAAQGAAKAERLTHAAQARGRRIELNHGADAPLDSAEAVLRRPTRRLTETEAQAEALRLERQDRGHSLDRHGPRLTPADHARRVTTGTAPDGRFSPTRASTQFHDAKDWVTTREKALRFAEAKYGIEAGKAPAKSHGQPDRYEVILEYNRPVDSGMVGEGATKTLRHPVTGVRSKAHVNARPIDGVPRTKTTIAWDKAQNRWVVAQHMPWAEGWDNASKTYERTAVVHAQGVVLDNTPGGMQ